MIVSFLAVCAVCYITSLALSLILWISHTLWCVRHLPPMLSEEQAQAALFSDRGNSIARRAFFTLALPLIYAVKAQQHTNTLLRCWHDVAILHRLLQ